MADRDRGDSGIPLESVEEYLALRQKQVAAAKTYYFEKLMPLMRPIIERQCDRFRDRRCAVLLSLMGFSPETTVIASLILRPKKLVIAYSQNAREEARPALRYLAREGIVDEFDVERIAIDPFDARDIYDKIERKLDELGDLDDLVFDITGGTKIMSATAGALAWEKNLTLSYLEGFWDPRSGSAGLEKASHLMLVDNPSRSRGYECRRQALASFEHGTFVAAAEKFSISLRLIDNDNSFDLIGRSLSLAYAAVADFDCAGVGAALPELRETFGIGSVRSLWLDRLPVEPHLEALRCFASRDLRAMTAGFMEFAELYARQGRHDFAGLLSYRAMEALVELGLKRIVPEFDMRRPRWDLFSLGEEELRRRYGELGAPLRSILPDRDLALQTGFGVLCVVDDVAGRFQPGGTAKSAIGTMMRLGEIRNRSYLAHGFENLGSEDSAKLRVGANDLAAAVLRDEHAELEVLRAHLRPLNLRELWPVHGSARAGGVA